MWMHGSYLVKCCFQSIKHHGVTTPKTSTWQHVYTDISHLANSYLISTSYGMILCVSFVAVNVEFNHKLYVFLYVVLDINKYLASLMVKVIRQQSAAVVMALSHWIALYSTPHLCLCKTVCSGILFYLPTTFTLNMATVMYSERLEQLHCITVRNP
jgi:hypothetical protein